MEENLKKIKRILALIGAVILAVLYILTLVFAIFDNPATMSYFKACVTLTIFIPVLIYGYQLVYRVLRDYGAKNAKQDTEKNDTLDEHKE